MNHDDLLNLQPIDPFADAEAEANAERSQGSLQQIHLRCQQRNGRKCITTHKISWIRIRFQSFGLL